MSANFIFVALFSFVVTGISHRCGNYVKHSSPLAPCCAFLKDTAEGLIPVCTTPSAAQGVGFRKQSVVLRETQVSVMQASSGLALKSQSITFTGTTMGWITCNCARFQQV